MLIVLVSDKSSLATQTDNAGQNRKVESTCMGRHLSNSNQQVRLFQFNSNLINYKQINEIYYMQASVVLILSKIRPEIGIKLGQSN